MQPLVFNPVYMERLWGGRELERVYRRTLPTADKPYGESWEIVDREEAQSIVAEGPLQGKSLHELWTNHRDEIFGTGLPDSERFPILLKILDARDDLSIQVHPPNHLASTLGGEPKTEMWVIADCNPGAKLYVGLKNGVDRTAFETAIHDGSVARCVHAITPSPGDSIFIPSGRLHAIGAGFLIHEIQQNSDTTYRVFDWNRLGLDGQPRDLHIESSLASIDFDDFEPAMDKPAGTLLAECRYFRTECLVLAADEQAYPKNPDHFVIFSILSGSLRSNDGRTFANGRSILIPQGGIIPTANVESKVLRITLPAP